MRARVKLHTEIKLADRNKITPPLILAQGPNTRVLPASSFRVQLSARWVSARCAAELPSALQSSTRALVLPVTLRLSCRPATAGTAEHSAIYSFSRRVRKSLSSMVNMNQHTLVGSYWPEKIPFGAAEIANLSVDEACAGRMVSIEVGVSLLDCTSWLLRMLSDSRVPTVFGSVCSISNQGL